MLHGYIGDDLACIMFIFLFKYVYSKPTCNGKMIKQYTEPDVIIAAALSSNKVVFAAIYAASYAKIFYPLFGIIYVDVVMSNVYVKC